MTHIRSFFLYQRGSLKHSQLGLTASKKIAMFSIGIFFFFLLFLKKVKCKKNQKDQRSLIVFPMHLASGWILVFLLLVCCKFKQVFALAANILPGGSNNMSINISTYYMWTFTHQCKNIRWLREVFFNNNFSDGDMNKSRLLFSNGWLIQNRVNTKCRLHLHVNASSYLHRNLHTYGQLAVTLTIDNLVSQGPQNKH